MGLLNLIILLGKLVIFCLFWWAIIPYKIYKFVTEQRKRKMINEEYKEYKANQSKEKKDS